MNILSFLLGSVIVEKECRAFAANARRLRMRCGRRNP
ncbi:hypothetical protein BMAPRL20_A0082 [Burkholderia mallei PRL-20]|nr:hypothetical protein BMAPRL20_A0082 [Burkholderia mallei PRL-20]